MKTLRYLLAALAVLAGVLPGFAGEPTVVFAADTHDFGTIRADGGAVKYDYEFTNTGDRPLAIVSVTNGGCGCTKPSFPKEPIAPGKKGKVTITFNPAGRSGEFSRAVKVRTTGTPKRVTLKFKGVIVP